MKTYSVSKKQLAQAMGISLPTLRAWLLPHKAKLAELGVKTTDKVLKPQASQWVCKLFELNLQEIAGDEYLKESESK